jgi:hypothetical protein
MSLGMTHEISCWRLTKGARLVSQTSLRGMYAVESVHKTSDSDSDSDSFIKSQYVLITVNL